MEALLWATVAVPAVLALVVRACGPAAGTAVALSALASLVPATVLLIAAAGGERAESAFVWLPGADLELGLRLDGLSGAMTALVGGIGLAALVNGAGYFSESARAPQAHASLLAFLAAMQGLVLAANFLSLLIFWELVGALSMRLIAHEREDPRAPEGSVRAFLTTRSADAGLYIGVAALFAGSGALEFAATRPDGFLGVAVGVGLLLAAAGKSAQVPFQTWLSGAMAGPTPVSALLHSATMVAAGVYLLVRAEPLLAGWPLEAAGWLGAITALAAAAFALAQPDLKQVLASSTSSQLGLMFVAAAVAPAVAIFHLICHAAGKAGAFLSTGLFQRRRGTTSLSELEGIGRKERRAFLGFAIGVASIAGVPPLAAYWSKDTVLKEAEKEAGWLVLALLASTATAAYMLRPALLLWRPAAQEGDRPSGRGWMLAGSGLLALGSLSLGAIYTPLGELLGEALPAPSLLTLGLSLAALVAGVAVIAARLRPSSRAVALAEGQLGTNAALRALVQRPVLALAGAVDRVDRAIDGGVDALGRATVGLARGNDRLERRGIDGAVDGLARLVARGGGELPRLQSGQLYQYLRNSVVGVALLASVLTVVAIA